MKHKKLVIVSASAIILALSAFGLINFKKLHKNITKIETVSSTEPETKASENAENIENVTPEPAKTETPKPAVAEPPPIKQLWPITYSANESSSLTVVVNKKHKLPSDYAPAVVSVSGGNLRSEAATEMSLMLTDAENSGVGMKIISSYRSYNTQVTTYQKWVNQQGQAEADRGSARPGHSEHQTGLAADLGNPDGSCNLLACFGSGAPGVWLANNAHTYGFIIRYPDGKETLTGYQYEPWHVRYVGVDVATAIYQSGQTLDQYYGVEAGGY